MASVSPRAIVKLHEQTSKAHPTTLRYYFEYLLHCFTHLMKIPVYFLTIYQHYLPPNRVSCSIHSSCMLGILDCWHSLLVSWVLLNKILIWWWGYIKCTPNLATVPLRNLFFLIVCSNLKYRTHQLLIQAYTGTEKLCNFTYTDWTEAKGNKTI